MNRFVCALLQHRWEPDPQLDGHLSRPALQPLR
jgi:hypothetical protein